MSAKRIGILALVICLSFAGLIMVLTAFGINDLGQLHIAVAVVIGVAHLVAYVAMLAALLAAERVGVVPAGRFASRAFSALRWSLVGLIVGMVAGALTLLVPAIEDVFVIVISLVFLAAHLMATLFGAALWQARTTSMLTAGLFICVVPAIVAVVALNVAGVEVFPAVFEAVMALAFASLGSEVAFGRVATA